MVVNRPHLWTWCRPHLFLTQTQIVEILFIAISNTIGWMNSELHLTAEWWNEKNWAVWRWMCWIQSSDSAASGLLGSSLKAWSLCEKNCIHSGNSILTWLNELTFLGYFYQHRLIIQRTRIPLGWATEDCDLWFSETDKILIQVFISFAAPNSPERFTFCSHLHSRHSRCG